MRIFADPIVQKRRMSMRVFRVLFVAPVPYFKGGAERSLLDLMAARGVDPILAVPAAGPISAKADYLGIPWDIVDFGVIGSIRRPFRMASGIEAMSSLFRAAQKLNRVARQHRAELVHSNGLKAHAVALAARRLGGPPTIIHLRDIANNKIEKAVWKAFQLASDQTIIVSRACCPEKDLPRNVHVVHNGFSADVLAPREDDRESGRGLVLGFTAGRIHPFKGLHDLLDGMATARDLGCDVSLVVRGTFAEETPGYEEEIYSKVAALKLSGAVRFEGFVTNAAEVHKGIDIVCVPSTVPDPLPRSVMEAMGCGRVVIAAPCGGIPDMIIDGENGFLVSDPDSFASVVVRLHSDPDLRFAIGRAARARCESILASTVCMTK